MLMQWSLLCFVLSTSFAATAQSHFCDVNTAGGIDAVDVQLVINAALGLIPSGLCNVNGAGEVDAIDVQLVVNAALGLPVGRIVPDVFEMNESDAHAAITVAGLAVGTVSEESSEEVFAGCVLSQLPVAGSTVADGSSISLVFSTGPSGPSADTYLLPGDVPLEMVQIPTGTFMMGRYDGEQSSYAWEDPQHEVSVPQFWIGKFEVTKRQWQALMGTTPWSGQSYVLADLDSPATHITWNDAIAFIEALNTHTGLAFRLPSEAEWEYACRGHATMRHYWGDDLSYTQIGEYAWYYQNAYATTEQYAHVVGQKDPNAFGLHDMSGNVWEWCEDDWHSSYLGAPADGSAWKELPRSANRVFRGGSWYNQGFQSRSAYRYYAAVTYKMYDLGLRVAR